MNKTEDEDEHEDEHDSLPSPAFNHTRDAVLPFFLLFKAVDAN